MRRIVVYLLLIFSWSSSIKIKAMDHRPVSATTTITESYSPFASPDYLDDETLPIFSPRTSPPGVLAPTPVSDALPSTPPNSARKSSGRHFLFSPLPSEARGVDGGAFLHVKADGWDLDNSRIACKAII